MNTKLTVLLGTLLLSGCSTMNHDNSVDQSKNTTASSKAPAQTCDSPYESHYGKHAIFNTMVQQLNDKSGCSIQTDISDTGSVKINQVEGKMSIRQAVKTAISGTRLQVIEETAHTIKVK